MVNDMQYSSGKSCMSSENFYPSFHFFFVDERDTYLEELSESSDYF